MIPGSLALIPVIGVASILEFNSESSLVTKILKSRILVYIGEISYGIYLFHYPIIEIIKYKIQNELSLIQKILIVVLTFFWASISYKYLEQPVRELRIFKTRTIYLLSLLISIIFILISTFIINSKIEQKSFLTRNLSQEQMNFFDLYNQQTKKNLSASIFDNQDCNYAFKSSNIYLDKRFSRCFTKYGKAVVLLGDSHAINLYNILGKTKKYPFLVGYVRGGCRPDNLNKSCQYSSFKKFVKDNSDKIKTLIFHQSGSYFIEDNNGNVDSSNAFLPGVQFRISKINVHKTLIYLQELSFFNQVIWIGPFKESRVELDDSDNWRFGLLINGESILKFKKLDKVLISNLTNRDFNFIHYLRFDNLFDYKYDVVQNNCIIYNDGDHFSSCGENLLANKLKSTI